MTPSLTLSAYANVLLALAVWREARGTSDAAKLAVAWVIRNRANDMRGRWAANIPNVILQNRQFSSFNNGDPNALRFPKTGDQSFVACCAVVDSAEPDPTGGAQYYHSEPVGSPHWPAWANEFQQTVVIGPFRFYKAP